MLKTKLYFGKKKMIKLTFGENAKDLSTVISFCIATKKQNSVFPLSKNFQFLPLLKVQSKFNFPSELSKELNIV